jgi:hypothetical protein
LDASIIDRSCFLNSFWDGSEMISRTLGIEALSQFVRERLQNMN